MRRRKSIKKGNPSGFSLIEVLISIIVIAILMLPLLNHFITAAKINQKMARIRSVEVMTENLMEALKVRSLEQILQQFALDDTDLLKIKEYELLPLWDGSRTYAKGLLRLDPNNLWNQYAGATTEKSDCDIYEFSIDQLTIGAREYDVTICMDYKSYTNAAEDGAPTNPYNEYELPVLNELDEKAVAMLEGSSNLEGGSSDAAAILEFQSRRNEYIAEKDQQNALLWEDYYHTLAVAEESGEELNPVPTEPPAYASPRSYTESELTAMLSKQVRIRMENKGLNGYQMVAEAQYTLDHSLPVYGESLILDSEQQTYQEVLYRQDYAHPIRYLYFFYQPSQFQNTTEQIVFCNQQIGADSNVIETMAYIVKQDGEETLNPVNPYCCFVKDVNCTSPVRLYTNLPSGSKGYQLQVFSESDVLGTVEKRVYDQWICNITIDVYQHSLVEAYKYREKVYTLSSTVRE